MSDFTLIKAEANVGNNSSASWVTITGSNHSLRFANSASVSLSTAAASWVNAASITLPASGTQGVPYAYAFTADTTGNGVFAGGAASAPATWALTQYIVYRWSWDNTGTFLSAPIMTCYASTGHGAISRGDGSLVGGHASDTGGTARSYLKGASYGAGSTTQTPGSASGSTPLVTDGSTGAVTAGSSAWSAWQSLQGDNDYIQYGNVPTAVTAQVWYFILRMFIGANETAGVITPDLAFTYTFT